MKYIKTILLATCLPLLFTACDNDDEEKRSINTTNTTVEFEQTSITVKETETFLNIPVTVPMDVSRDGDVIIQVKATRYSENLSVDKEIILTSQELRIPREKFTMNVELGLMAENKDIETGRYITLEIIGAQGASIGNNSQCTVYLNEKNYVEGTYTVRGVNPVYGYIYTEQVIINAGDETLNSIGLSFGLDGEAKITFRELIADRLYNISISPFSLVGNYNDKPVYLTWISYDEEKLELNYDREKMISGTYEITMEDGEEVRKFTLSDGFGLLSFDDEGEVSWYDNYIFNPQTTMTKIDD